MPIVDGMVMNAHSTNTITTASAGGTRTTATAVAA